MTRVLAIALTGFVATTCALTVGACSDFAVHNTCLQNAANCVPDPNNFEIPNLNGPNPNFPDPNAAPPSRAKADQIGVSVDTLVLNEVVLGAVGDSASSPAIELRNVTDGVLDLSAWSVIANGQRVDLPEGWTMPAHSVVVICAGEASEGEPGEVFVSLNELRVGSKFPVMSADRGSIALVNAEGRIVDYIQWGEAGQELEAEAWRAGCWTPGDAVTLPPEGMALHRVRATRASSSFVHARPSIGDIGAIDTLPQGDAPELTPSAE